MEKYDTIIVGNGPAGLTAAIYAMRAELKTLVISPNPAGGGQINDTYEIDNYPGLPGLSGAELGEKLKDHAEKLGAVFKIDSIKEIEDRGDDKILRSRRNEYHARSVIVTSGAGHRKLGVKGEHELAGMGVSYCAVCDGAFFKGKKVAVVGGGDSALGDAIYLSGLAEKVYLIHRRDEFRAAPLIVKEASENEKIEFVLNSVPEEISGNGKVEHIFVTNKISNETRDLEVDGVFIAVGIVPNSNIEGLPSKDENGYIIAGEDCVTDIPGIFAAGDVRTKPLRQVITAAADGANAVYSVQKYLSSYNA